MTARTQASALDELVHERGEWRRAGLTVVFTNGCFDLLHAGHVSLLEAARAAGDVLIVGLNSDDSVRRLKGEGRPILPQHERAETLLAFEAVDRVVIYDADTPAQVIGALVPDVLVKGADWGPGEIVGADVVEAAGGRVLRIALEPGRSTSALVDRVRGS